MFHFHGLQRHDRLAGRDTLAHFHQESNNAAVHRRAHLAVAGCRRCCRRRRQRKIADRKRDAVVQHVKPVAIPEEAFGLGNAVAAEADDVATEFVDFKPVLDTLDVCEIGAVALAHDLNVVDASIELDPNGSRKRRGERPPATPWSRIGVADIKQQGCQRHIRRRILARRQQGVPMLLDESGGGFAAGKGGMPQARHQKPLIGGYPERRGLLEAAD